MKRVLVHLSYIVFGPIAFMVLLVVAGTTMVILLPWFIIANFHDVGLEIFSGGHVPLNDPRRWWRSDI